MIDNTVKEENQISDFAFVDPSVVMGKGNIVCEGAIIRAGVVMNDNNYIGPYCIIGDAPEKIGAFDEPNKGVYIGSKNRFTKQVTIDAGANRITYIGDHNLFLKNSHIGHDCSVGHHNIFSCNAMIGGFVNIANNCNFGLGAAVHQQLSIPDGVMIGMNSTVTKKSKLMSYRKYAGSPVKDIGSNVQACLD